MGLLDRLFKPNIFRASEKGDIATVEALLSQGAHVNTATNDGWTALMYATFKGNIRPSKSTLGFCPVFGPLNFWFLSCQSSPKDSL